MNDHQKSIEERKRKQQVEDQQDIELAAYLHKIGLKKLSDEVRDLRFRNRVIEAQRWLDVHDAKVSYEEVLHDKIDQRIIDNSSRIFDRTQSYNNVILTLGYAGLFAIWSLVKDLLNPWDMTLVAALVGSSLIVFLAWTIVLMVTYTVIGHRNIAVIRQYFEDRHKMLEAIQEQDLRNQKTLMRVNRFWFPVFIFTVLTAFSGSFLLLAHLFADVFGWSFSLEAYLK